jgi:uncharacterized protein (TIGR02271 family)
MPTQTEVLSWRGRDAVDRDGAKIGTIDQIYLDNETEQPEWVTVRTGMLGRRTSFVPLSGADLAGDAVRLPYERTQIEQAPGIDPEANLSPEEETNLYRHYGLDYGAGLSSGVVGGEGLGGTDRDAPQGAVGHDTSGPTTDSAMTRSEEELRIGTTRQEAGRARLRKYVETEQVTETVPVERERAVVEREPITDANIGRAMDGPAISEEEHEVVLTEEQVVAEKQAVPKERVRLDTETVTEQQEVSETLRKERIDVDGDVEGGRGSR